MVRVLAFLSIYDCIVVLFLSYLIAGEWGIQWTCWCIEEKYIAAILPEHYLIGSSVRFVMVEAWDLCIQRLCVKGYPHVYGLGWAAGEKLFSFIREKHVTPRPLAISKYSSHLQQVHTHVGF